MVYLSLKFLDRALLLWPHSFCAVVHSTALLLHRGCEVSEFLWLILLHIQFVYFTVPSAFVPERDPRSWVSIVGYLHCGCVRNTEN